jgi:dolichol kinase
VPFFKLKMETLVKRSLIGLLAIVVSLITYYFFYGWYDVFPWAIVAFTVGYISKDRRDSIFNGAIFGYFLFLVYIFAGYKNKTGTSGFIYFILFDLFFSLVGAIAGIIGSFIGNWVKRKFGR